MISNLDNYAAGATSAPSTPTGEISSILFDIETGPESDEVLAALEPEFEAPANYKDPEKIAAAIAEKRAAWRERAALSPTTGRVLAIGLIADGVYQAGHVFVTDSQQDERLLLEWFFGKISRRTMLLGFNSHRFDLPFLIRRAWKLGVHVPHQLLAHRFGGSSVDMMEIWQLGDRVESISLDRLARYLGVGEKTGNGADFARLFAEDRDAALAYLRNDIALTAAVAVRLNILDASKVPDLSVEPALDY